MTSIAEPGNPQAYSWAPWLTAGDYSVVMAGTTRDRWWEAAIVEGSRPGPWGLEKALEHHRLATQHASRPSAELQDVAKQCLETLLAVEPKRRITVDDMVVPRTIPRSPDALERALRAVAGWDFRAGLWCRDPADRPRHVAGRGSGRKSPAARRAAETLAAPLPDDDVSWAVSLDKETGELLEAHVADLRAEYLWGMGIPALMSPRHRLALWLKWNVESHLAWEGVPVWMRRATILNEDMESLASLFTGLLSVLQAIKSEGRRPEYVQELEQLWPFVGLVGAVRFWVMPDPEVLRAQGFTATPLSELEKEWHQRHGRPGPPDGTPLAVPPRRTSFAVRPAPTCQFMDSRSSPVCTEADTFAPASTRTRLPRADLDDRWRNSTVRRQVLAVVEAEGPIVSTRLAKVVGSRFGLKVVRAGRAQRILDLLPAGQQRRSANGDLVAWPEGVKPQAYHSFRPGPGRQLDEIPYEELRNAMCHAVQEHEVPVDELILRIAQIFGFQRVGSGMRQRLDDVLTRAIAEKRLVQDADVVRWISHRPYRGR